jgi:hypothetical protein
MTENIPRRKCQHLSKKYSKGRGRSNAILLSDEQEGR